MIGNFYFKRSNDEEVLLAGRCSEEEAWVAMKKFLDDHNYNFFYTRMWIDPENEKRKIYDVGSYSEFFIYEQI